MLPIVEVIEEAFASSFLGDQDVEHTLCFLVGLLQVPVKVEKWSVAWMADSIFRLLKGQRKFLAVDEAILVAVEVSITCYQWIQSPSPCRNVPCREQEFHSIQHPIAIGVDIVGVRGPSGQVDLILRKEITK